MLAKIKNCGIFLWLQRKSNEHKRQQDFKKIAKQEKLWDLKLRGRR